MKCGLGNWTDIAEQYVKTKQAKDCEEHYWSFFYKSKDNALPSDEDLILKQEKRISKNGLGVIEVDE